jgi:hypothetical protein
MLRTTDKGVTKAKFRRIRPHKIINSIVTIAPDNEHALIFYEPDLFLSPFDVDSLKPRRRSALAGARLAGWMAKWREILPKGSQSIFTSKCKSPVNEKIFFNVEGTSNNPHISINHTLLSSVYPPTEVSGSSEVPGRGIFETL